MRVSRLVACQVVATRAYREESNDNVIEAPVCESDVCRKDQIFQPMLCRATMAHLPTHIVKTPGQDDPKLPRNWSLQQKLTSSSILLFGLLVIISTSTLVLPDTRHVNDKHAPSPIAAACFMLGIVSGFTVWSPLSQLYGRRPLIISTALAFSFCNISQVLFARTGATVCQVLAGFFGSALLLQGALSFSEVWMDEGHRDLSSACLSLVMVAGPYIGSISADLLSGLQIGWRWKACVPMSLGLIVSILAATLLKESYTPVILATTTNQLRQETRNWLLHDGDDEKREASAENDDSLVPKPRHMCRMVLVLTIYAS